MAITYTVKIIGVQGSAEAGDWPLANQRLGEEFELTQAELDVLSVGPPENQSLTNPTIVDSHSNWAKPEGKV